MKNQTTGLVQCFWALEYQFLSAQQGQTKLAQKFINWTICATVAILRGLG